VDSDPSPKRSTNVIGPVGHVIVGGGVFSTVTTVVIDFVTLQVFTATKVSVCTPSASCAGRLIATPFSKTFGVSLYEKPSNAEGEKNAFPLQANSVSAAGPSRTGGPAVTRVSSSFFVARFPQR